MTETVTHIPARRSLRRRVTTSMVLIALVVLVVVEAATFLLFRQLLEAELDETLGARVALAEAVAEERSGAGLAERLETIGIRATITEPDGTVSRSSPRLPRVPRDLPAPGTAPDPRDVESRSTVLPDGSTAVVTINRTGVDQSLRRLLLVEVAATLVALGVVLLASRRASRRALSPISTVVGFVDRIGAGERSTRLRPDDRTTEIGQLAEAVDSMVVALRAGEAELRDQVVAGRRFLADAAHQLRTPVAGIRASIDLVSAHPGHQRNAELLDNVAREAARVSRLIDRLLTLARLDQHRGEPASASVDLGDLLDRELERVRSLAPELTVRRTGTGLVQASPDDLSEAVANLLDNARQNARSSIHVTVTSTGGRVCIAIDDDGPTMTTEEAVLATERFHTTRPGGTGLGLPIAKAIVEAHGGELNYRGGTVHIDLPVDRALTC